MFSIIRSRAVALPGSTPSVTRFLPALPTSTRALSATTLRAFANSHVSREWGRGGGSGGRFSDSPQRESFGSRERRTIPKNPPSTTLWVGNLPFNARPEELQELFGEFGTVVSVRIGMSPTGESKGFAHVDFSDVANAEAAMQANTESQFFLEGRGLNMDFALPQPARPSFPPGETLHFNNYSGDEALLEETLKDYAEVVKNIQIMRNPQTGESSRFGFIEFTSTEDATAVMEKLQGKEIAYGETLTLSYARGKKAPPLARDQGGEGFGYGARRGGGDDAGGRPPRQYNNNGPPRGGSRGGYRGGDRDSRPRQDYGGRGGYRGGGEDRSYGRGPSDGESPY